ncbi:MAG TPA: hypothetical protein VMS54_12955 [Vicinamibacterales bacterium]|nr:hypothetical protein [Vicinamibacterales bacterium]
MAKYPNEPEGQRPPQQTPSQSQRPGQSQGPPPPLQSGQRLNVQFVTVNDPVDTVARLNDRGALTVAFPPCAEEIVSLIRTADQDEITKFFNEYFIFGRHLTFGDLPIERHPHDDLDPQIFCPVVGATSTQPTDVLWPSKCCVCSPCLTLNGNRNPPAQPHTTVPQLRRLFLGDVLWAFYFDRMGIHQILGAILDSFAYNGRLPISNGSIDLTTYRDDITALVLEIMVRQTKTGMSSTTRDRNALFRTSLGWVTETGRKLNLDTQVNTGFNSLFHKFIFHAQEFYRDKRLAVAIQGAAGGVAKPSVATLITISNTIDVLKKRFEAFQYGRNYYNALSSILWTIGGLTIIRELRTTIGIPSAFDAADEFVPAAYDLLVLKRPVTQGDTNRFIVHRQAAQNGRDLLLDMEVINHLDTGDPGELSRWLTQVEPRVEAYRTAYQTLTGVDLGASPTSTIEQQA